MKTGKQTKPAYYVDAMKERNRVIFLPDRYSYI